MSVFFPARRVLSALCVLLPFASEAKPHGTPPACVNPGNFHADKVPQFVCLGSDDNYCSHGMKWLLDAMRARRNPSQAAAAKATYDGSPARLTFFVNTNNSYIHDVTSKDPSMIQLAEQFRIALADGHEIGSHTKSHTTGTETTLERWKTEIDSSLIDLRKVGIPRGAVKGFRSPFLSYNEETFKVLDAMGFKYDCSIVSGWNETMRLGDFAWPFTLDEGPLPGDTTNVPVIEKDGMRRAVRIGRHPGLWELPVPCLIVPPERRRKIWDRRSDKVKDSLYVSTFDTATGEAEGQDYVLWSGPSNYGGLGFDSADFATTLKYSLDLRRKGNRAPLCFLMHSNIFYDTLGYLEEGDPRFNGPGAKSPRASVTQMRGALLDFIGYALSLPEVRIVTYRDLVAWCEKPAPFHGPVGSVSVAGPPKDGPLGAVHKLNQ